jgi:hypothetical protein
MTDSTVTLSSTMHLVSPFFTELDILQDIFEHGVSACSHVTSISLKVSRLLDVIFKVMNDFDDFGLHHTTQVKPLVLLQLEVGNAERMQTSRLLCN